MLTTQKPGWFKDLKTSSKYFHRRTNSIIFSPDEENQLRKPFETKTSHFSNVETKTADFSNIVSETYEETKMRENRIQKEVDYMMSDKFKEECKEEYEAKRRQRRAERHARKKAQETYNMYANLYNRSLNEFQKERVELQKTG